MRVNSPLLIKLFSVLKSIFIFVLLPILSCENLKMTNTKPTTMDKQGHRGCRGLMPENTIEAMLRAIDLGVNTLEMDVVISADKLVVVSHEPFFNHEISTKPDGKYVEANEEKSLNMYKMNYDEIRKFDV